MQRDVIVATCFLVIFCWTARSLVLEEPSGSLRWKRIVLGDGNETSSVTLPTRPLPIGNLTGPQGEAVCYFLNSRFYCFSRFLASQSEASRYCRSHKMMLLSIRSEEEHEYLFDFLSNHHSTAEGTNPFLRRRTDDELQSMSDEEYAAHVEDNIAVGMLVQCLSVCGQQIRPSSDLGHVLDYEVRDYIGLAVKVQWATGMVRWYPASNIQLIGYESAEKRRPHAPEGALSLEETIFEPGDRVRIKSPPGEVGVLSVIDFNGEAALVRFPSNKGWRGQLDDLEIVDKRKASGTFWTSGRFRRSSASQLSWMWEGDANGRVGQMQFTNWAIGEPMRGDPTDFRPCLAIRYQRNGKWFASNCNKQYFFICQR